MRCRGDEGRLIDGRTQRVGQAMAEERDHLLALPVEGFDLAEISFPIVDGGGCVRTNAYSTPVRPGTTVQVKVYPAHLNRVQFETHRFRVGWSPFGRLWKVGTTGFELDAV
jgi:hypothetical protein